jgi:hypothetical protein
VRRRLLGESAGLDEQLRGAAVGRGAFDHVGRLVDRRADDWVDEVQHGVEPENLGTSERRRFGCGSVLEPGELGGQPQFGALSENGDHAGDPGRLFRKACQALPDAACDRVGSDLVDALRRVSCWRTTLGRESCHQRTQVERVSRRDRPRVESTSARKMARSRDSVSTRDPPHADREGPTGSPPKLDGRKRVRLGFRK